MRASLSKLRIFWIPADFNADDEISREVVRDSLQRDMYKDLLLKIALGGITSQDVRNFAISGRLGFPPWILSKIKEDGYLDNYTSASRRYKVGIPSLKEELLRLELTGMLSREENTHGLIRVTEKGRAMLDICAHLHQHLSGMTDASEEFLYICQLLDMDFGSLALGGQQVNFDVFRENQNSFRLGHEADNATLLLACLFFSSQHGEIEWRPSTSALPSGENLAP